MSKPLTKEMQLRNNSKKAKKKRCKECGELFTPSRDLQPCCSYGCETAYISKNLNGLIKEGKRVRNKAANKKKTESKANDLKVLKQLAQTIVNKYVRLRDKNKKECISCDYIFNHGTRQIHASHFQNVGGHQQLRFNTLNIWASCSICNNHLSGNLVPYRKELIKKIGIERVESFECNQERGHYTVEYLQRLIKVFRKKIRLYEAKFR